MNCNTAFQLIGGLINVIGTTYAVLSVLRLTFEDIHSVITLDGMDKRDTEELLVQREQARTGISYVILGWLVQLVFSFFDIETVSEGLLGFVSIIVLAVCVWFSNRLYNRNYRERYLEYRKAKMDEQAKKMRMRESR